MAKKGCDELLKKCACNKAKLKARLDDKVSKSNSIIDEGWTEGGKKKTGKMVV